MSSLHPLTTPKTPPRRASHPVATWSSHDLAIRMLWVAQHELTEPARRRAFDGSRCRRISHSAVHLSLYPVAGDSATRDSLPRWTSNGRRPSVGSAESSDRRRVLTGSYTAAQSAGGQSCPTGGSRDHRRPVQTQKEDRVRLIRDVGSRCKVGHLAAKPSLCSVVQRGRVCRSHQRFDRNNWSGSHRCWAARHG